MKQYRGLRRRAFVAFRAPYLLICGVLLYGIFVVLGRRRLALQTSNVEATYSSSNQGASLSADGPTDPMKQPKRGLTLRSTKRIDEYFDGVYLLNLDKRSMRLALADKRMRTCDIKYKRFGATDGSVMRRVWMSYAKTNPYFTNPNYLACAISHLAIYKDALEKGYQRILVVEDDNRIRNDANELFSKAIDHVPLTWELLYLGFIPLNDDQSMWNYNVFQIIGDSVARAKNFWGLFGYAITAAVMNETLDAYDRDFPMELDRYFVSRVQPRNKSYGIIPQIFAAEDGVSDNSGRNEHGMLQRSIDARFGRVNDYA